VVALTPSTTAGSSVANSGIPLRDSFFQLQRVEDIAAGAFDVLTDDGGEFRGVAGGLGEQVGHAAVAGQAGIGEGPPHLAAATGFEVQVAGLDVPVPGGDEPAGRQPGPGRADLPVQRGPRVLHL
jgi:hypothetical protein